MTKAETISNNEASVTFNHIKVSKIHPTFGAEISGVDFTSTLNDEVFAEISAAAAKVGNLGHSIPAHTMLVLIVSTLVWRPRLPKHWAER